MAMLADTMKSGKWKPTGGRDGIIDVRIGRPGISAFMINGMNIRRFLPAVLVRDTARSAGLARHDAPGVSLPSESANERMGR
jgi:hypothetical protein